MYTLKLLACKTFYIFSTINYNLFSNSILGEHSYGILYTFNHALMNEPLMVDDLGTTDKISDIIHHWGSNPHFQSLQEFIFKLWILSKRMYVLPSRNLFPFFKKPILSSLPNNEIEIAGFVLLKTESIVFGQIKLLVNLFYQTFN